MKRGSNRNTALDVGRLLWCYLIIQFHTGGVGFRVAYGALPAFIIVSIYFGLQSSSEGRWVSGVVRKSQRLLLPWVFWSLVYLASEYWRSGFKGGEVTVRNIFYGGEIHLWFLPFIFCAIVLGDLVAIWSMRFGLRGISVGAAIGMCVAIMVYMVLDRLPAVVPVSQFKFGTVSAAMGWCFWSFRSLAHPRGIAASCCSSLVVLVVVHLLGEPLREIYPQMIGAAMVCIVLVLHSGPLCLSRIGRKYTLFIYLVHVLVWQLLYKFVGLDGSAAAILVFSVSLILAYIVDFFLSSYQDSLPSRLRILIGL
ncbi:MAG: acyltransferase family protein [Phycisphaerales bacterium JB052]